MPDSPSYPALLEAYLSARYRNQRMNRELRVGDLYADTLPTPGCVHAQLSACNPASGRLSTTENERRTRLLADRLARHGLKADPAINTGPDGEWPEPAFWIEDANLDVIDRLAGEFGQNACLAVGGDALIRLRLYLPAWQPYTVIDQRLRGLD